MTVEAMREVSKDEFFEAMACNVHPNPRPDRTDWEMQDGSRRLIGRSLPGYLCDGPQRWFLAI